MCILQASVLLRPSFNIGFTAHTSASTQVPVIYRHMNKAAPRPTDSIAPLNPSIAAEFPDPVAEGDGDDVALPVVVAPESEPLAFFKSPV